MRNLIHLAIPGFLLLLLIEVIAAAWMHQDLFEWKDTAASLTMGIGNVIIGLFTKVLLFASYSFVHRFALFNIGYQWWYRGYSAETNDGPRAKPRRNGIHGCCDEIRNM